MKFAFYFYLCLGCTGALKPTTSVNWKVQQWSKVAASSMLAAACVSAPIASCQAADKRIASIAGSGFIFKDKLNVDSYADPKIDGISIYLSDFELPSIEKFGKFFADPSQSGLSCVRQVAPLTIKSPLPTGEGGEEIVSESKAFLGQKTVKINRIYDQKANAVVYVAYTSRLNKDDDSNKVSSSLDFFQIM